MFRKTVKASRKPEEHVSEVLPLIREIKTPGANIESVNCSFASNVFRHSVKPPSLVLLSFSTAQP